MATMYKFVSYTGLDCSAFFFWDFFFFVLGFLYALHGVFPLFIYFPSLERWYYFSSFPLS